MSATLPPNAPDLSGTQYELERLLGEGGFGQAYLAFNKGLRRRCVIKLLTDTTNPGFVARFYREAQVMANLDHTTIPHVHEVATTKDGRPYFVMEFVDGKSLGEHVADEGGTLSISEACRLTADAAEGLAAAHEVGIVHRDVKLANLLVNKKNQLKVIDFGIARKTIEEGETTAGIHTRQGELLGTPRYMSPEQCMAKSLGPASDFYSLGVVLFILLTGQSPFDGTAYDMMMHHVREPPPRLGDVAGKSFPPELEALVARMLMKDPRARFSNGQELAIELRRFTTQGAHPATSAPPHSPSVPPAVGGRDAMTAMPSMSSPLPLREHTPTPSISYAPATRTEMRLGSGVRGMVLEPSVTLSPISAFAHDKTQAADMGAAVSALSAAYGNVPEPSMTAAPPGPTHSGTQALPRRDITPSSLQTAVGITPPKTSTNRWPLVLVAVVVLAVPAVFFAMRARDQASTTSPSDTGPGAPSEPKRKTPTTATGSSSDVPVATATPTTPTEALTQSAATIASSSAKVPSRPTVVGTSPPNKIAPTAKTKPSASAPGVTAAATTPVPVATPSAKSTTPPVSSTAAVDSPF